MGIGLVRLGREEVLHEAEDEDLSNFKAGFAGKQDFIAGHYTEHALPVVGQAV